MMHAIHIELFDHMLDTTMDSIGGKDLWADSDEFIREIKRAGFNSATGAAPETDSRFRVYLKVPGKPQLTGVYYVGGWQDRGVVDLSWDDDQEHIVPRRREAVMATRRKG